MNQVQLIRFESSDFGTLGQLKSMGKHLAWTMEPPCRNNLPNKSCIPTGNYRCIWHKSPRYGWVYLVSGVPGRGHILIHPGNLGGDVGKGLITHTKGCILLGARTGWLSRQRAVLLSRPTVRRFFEALNKDTFNLKITEAPHVGNNR